MGGLGGPELLVVFLVVLLVFGPSRIPEVARGIGKAMREVRRLTTELQREINLADAEEASRKIRPESAMPAVPAITTTPPPALQAPENGPVPRKEHRPDAPAGAEPPDRGPDQETA